MKIRCGHVAGNPTSFAPVAAKFHSSACTAVGRAAIRHESRRGVRAVYSNPRDPLNGVFSLDAFPRKLQSASQSVAK